MGCLSVSVRPRYSFPLRCLAIEPATRSLDCLFDSPDLVLTHQIFLVVFLAGEQRPVVSNCSTRFMTELTVTRQDKSRLKCNVLVRLASSCHPITWFAVKLTTASIQGWCCCAQCSIPYTRGPYPGMLGRLISPLLMLGVLIRQLGRVLEAVPLPFPAYPPAWSCLSAPDSGGCHTRATESRGDSRRPTTSPPPSPPWATSASLLTANHNKIAKYSYCHNQFYFLSHTKTTPPR